MAESSAIEWTDATVNFWWGCTKVGPGCDNCYAEDLNRFRGTGEWGPGTPRLWIKGSTALISRLHRQHDKFFAAHGRHRRVFIQSMSDLFDNEVAWPWRVIAFDDIETADLLEIQIVTKRISNVERMVPNAWREGRWPRHVGLMVTVCTQAEADRDIPRLLDLKRRLGIPWVGLSMEPLLERVDLPPEWLAELDWIITGGESGDHARPMHPDWARQLRDQCTEAGVPFLFKQWGKWGLRSDRKVPYCVVLSDGRMLTGEDVLDEPNDEGAFLMWAHGKKAAGRLLDGRTHDAWPEVVR
jgi:protein gp37